MTVPGEGVVISARADVPDGMLIYGVSVLTADQATMKVCNFTGGTSPALSSLPIKTISFD